MAAPATSRRRSANGLTLDPDDPLIVKVGRAVQGPIVGAANFLDIPGSMARDVVRSVAEGRWHNPFDQLLDPFGSANRSTGRDVRISLGLGSRRSKGLSGLPADILTEVVFDPLSWANPFGALTKAGKVAQAAGIIGDAGRVATAAGRVGSKRAAQTSTRLAELLTTPELVKTAERAAGSPEKLQRLMDQPLRGALGIGPFGTGGAVGSGKMAQKLASGQDIVGEAIRYSRPVRAAASIMSRPVEGIKSKLVQKASKRLYENADKATAKSRAFIGKAIKELKDLEATHGKDFVDQISADQLRVLYEDPTTVKNLGGFDFKSRQEMYEQFPGLEPHVNRLLGRLHAQPMIARTRHLPGHVLTDLEIGEYFPAFKSAGAIAAAGGKGGGRVFNTFDPSFRIARLEARKHISGGTAGVKRIIMDEDIQRMLFRTGPSNAGDVAAEAGQGIGIPRTGMTAEEALKSGSVNFTPATQQELADEIERKFGDMFLNNPDKTPRQAASELARFIRTMTPEEAAVGVWGNHPLADFAVRDLHAAQAFEASDAAMDLLSDPEFYKFQGRSAKRVPLNDVLEQAGLQADTAMREIGSRLGLNPENVANMTVSKEHADDLGRMLKGFTSPESIDGVMKVVDGFTNLFRGLVTGPWPAFHGRNFASSQFMNFVSGMWSRWSIAAAHNLMTGKGAQRLKNIPIIRERLAQEGIAVTDETAADMERTRLFEHEIAPHNVGDISDVIGPLSKVEVSDLNSLLKQFPGGLGGTQPTTARHMIRLATGLDPDSTWKPWAVRGIGGRRQSDFTLAAAGEQLGGYIEGLARISPFLDQLSKGVDPATAAAKVKAAQIDYAARRYTAVERQGLTRIFPFYKFMRGSMPVHLRMLIDKPGGPLAQTLRVASGLRGEDQGPIPEHIAETTAIPIPEGTPLIGPKAGGDPRYLTGLGLMFEDAASLLPVGGGGIRGTGLELMSRMNPLLKGPAEYFTGQSFFQRGPSGGRPLEDLDPVLGRTARNVQQLYRGEGQEGYAPPVNFPGDSILEPVVANTPIARVATTLRTLTDPRKGATAKATNLLSGLRLSDISEAARSATLQQRVDEILNSFPQTRQFTRTYIPKDRLSEMSEEDRVEAQRMLELLDMLAERRREVAQQRKAKK